MKKMYTVGMYSTGDMTTRELTSILRNAGNFDNAVHTLVGMALRDPEPITHDEETRVAAEGHMNSSIDINKNTWAVTSYNITFAGIMEYWTADDDGEFLEGSDYDWNYTDSQLEELRELYNDVMGIDREEA